MDFISKLAGVFFRTPNVKHGMTLSLVIRVRKLSESGSISGPYTGKSDLKLDLLSLLTLITIKTSESFGVLQNTPAASKGAKAKIIYSFQNEKNLKRNVQIDKVNLFSRLNFRIPGH